MSSLLSVRELSIARAGKPVLKDISLDIYRGQFVVLVGPNGAGKSTLLEALSGALEPERGSIALAGQPLGEFTARARARQQCLLGRELGLLPRLTVRSVVSLGRLAHQDGWGLNATDERAIEEAIDEADIRSLTDRQLHTLSDGERQRVMWARALCQRASLLLLDEATAHLDIAHRERSFLRAAAFAKAGGAVLAVAHELGLALRHATRVIVLARGGIVTDATPALALRTEILREVFGVDAAVRTHQRGLSLEIYGVAS